MNSNGYFLYVNRQEDAIVEITVILRIEFSDYYSKRFRPQTNCEADHHVVDPVTTDTLGID